MADKDTVIVVGITRLDEYGNLWCTPQGGGDEIKIGVKRAQLHPMFEQGKAVLLHWETYMNRPYVADAKLVEGELPPPIKPYEAQPPNPLKPDAFQVKAEKHYGRDEDKVDIRTAIMEIGRDYQAGLKDSNNAQVMAREIWLSEKLNPYMMPTPQRGEDLPLPSEIRGIEQPKPKIEGTITLDQLKEKVAKKMGWKQSTTAYSFMVNKCKLTEEALNTNPTECWEQIKQLQGWTD